MAPLENTCRSNAAAFIVLAKLAGQGDKRCSSIAMKPPANTFSQGYSLPYLRR
jgi:hypothetical protein